MQDGCLLLHCGGGSWIPTLLYGTNSQGWIFGQNIVTFVFNFKPQFLPLLKAVGQNRGNILIRHDCLNPNMSIKFT